MRRAFDIDVLVCPRRGGRLRLIATVEEPKAIHAILAALVAPLEVAARAPPGKPAQTPSPATALGARAAQTRRTPRSVRLRAADLGLWANAKLP